MDSQDVLSSAVQSEALGWIARPIARRFGSFARSARHVSYFALAALFLVAIAANAIWEAVRNEAQAESIDLAVRARISSPVPDRRIVILDVDERALAMLAPERGRWPWPRSVLAEAIATVADAGARAVVVNVMMSDPDKGDPHADRVFDEVARATPNAVFPMIRLNPKNDSQSEVRAAMLPGVRLFSPAGAESRIAVLIPAFAGTHDKLGVNNLVADQDGVVRRYAVWRHEAGFALPSIALRAAQLLVGPDAVHTREEIILNWRNKRGDYRRVSFADFVLAAQAGSDSALEQFKGAVVILGVSAPGIANTKGTSASAVVDDNVILATAIDDIVNDTHLRVLPGWVDALISGLLVTSLALAFYRGIADTSINRWFALAQGALVVVTIGSASYTVYLADLSACFVFGLSYFLIAKLYALVDRNASRGMPAFTDIRFDPAVIDRVVVFGFATRGLAWREIVDAKTALERRFGVWRTFHIDNAFGIANLFGGTCAGLEFFVVFSGVAEIPAAVAGAGTASDLLGDTVGGPIINGFFDIRELAWAQAMDSAAIQREVGHALLRVADRLINPPDDDACPAADAVAAK